MQPDYTKELVDVYADTVRYTIKSNKEDGTLSDILFNVYNYPTTESDKYPLWFPRWDHKPNPQNIRKPETLHRPWRAGEPWRAGGHLDQEAELPSESLVLHTKGSFLGSINLIDDTLIREGKVLARVAQLWDRVYKAIEDSNRPEPLEVSFLTTITTGRAFRFTQMALTI